MYPFVQFLIRLRRRKHPLPALAGLIIAVTMALWQVPARAELVVHVCTSCELDEGGTGVALKNHVRGQLLQGHDVAVIMMDFSAVKKPKKTLEDSLTDISSNPGKTNYLRGSMQYSVSTADIANAKAGKSKLRVYRMVPPEDLDGPYRDQEVDIVHDLILMPKFQIAIASVTNDIMQWGAAYDKGIYSLQLHVYWNMVLEKEIARQFRLACNWTTDKTQTKCLHTPVVLWAHSDENAYTGKMSGDDVIKGRTRASVMLKDMISVADAVFTVSNNSRDQFLSETDVVGSTLSGLNNSSVGRGPFFYLGEFDPKKKMVELAFRAGPPELCNPLNNSDSSKCDRAHEKFVLPVFNGIVVAASDIGRMREAKSKRFSKSIDTNRDLITSMTKDYTIEDSDWTLIDKTGAGLRPDFRKSTASALKAGHKIVLSLGRINRSKNPKALVDKWEKVNDPLAHLLIVGPPEPDSDDSKQYFVEMLKAIADKNTALKVKYGVDYDLVHYLGPTNQAAALYTMADVFVSPSTAETQGMTVLEAMGAGTPVVANVTVPSYREFVCQLDVLNAKYAGSSCVTAAKQLQKSLDQWNGNGMLADPGDDAFFARIHDLLDSANADKAKAMAERGYATYPAYAIPSIGLRTDWALAALWKRINEPSSLILPLTDSTPIPNWSVILR